jgi:hypothetical protein
MKISMYITHIMKKKKLFAWGFCDKLSDLIDKIRTNSEVDLYNISDSPSADLNIYKCLKRKINHRKSNVVIDINQEFYKFKEMYSRHWYPLNINDKKYIQYYKEYFNFFLDLFNKQKFSVAIFSNIPHEGPDYIAYLTAKKLNIPTLIFHQSLFTNRSFASTDLKIYNDNAFDFRKTTEDYDNLRKVVLNTTSNLGKWFYMAEVNKKKKDLSFQQLLKNSRRHFKKNLFSMSKIFYSDLKFLNQYKKYVNLNIPLSELKYIYFPLHLQPELTTSAIGGKYCNQVLAIKDLSKSIPQHIKIIVKENPKQNAFKRPPCFYKEINSINNVILAPISFPTLKLIKNSVAVSTITGTVGWEAICSQKPVITFGTCWYRDFKNVYSFEKIIDFNKVLTQKPSALCIEDTINFIKNYTLSGTVDMGYTKSNTNYNHRSNIESLYDFMMNHIEGVAK